MLIKPPESPKTTTCFLVNGNLCLHNLVNVAQVKYFLNLQCSNNTLPKW